MKIRTVTVTFVLGLALLVSACSSSPKHSAAHVSPTPHNSATESGFPAGPDPCRLVTPHDILTALNQHMTKTSGSKSTCSYMNAKTTGTVSITTAKMTTTGAEQAVASSARTVKVKVRHLRGVGNTAVAYITTTKTRSIATCLFAKNGTFVFLLVGSPTAGHLIQEAIALAHMAAIRA